MDSIESPPTLQPGHSVADRYTIDGVLGAGGMGYVYSATRANGDAVALKILHPELLTNSVAVARFMVEAETIFKLSHPNIVEVFDYGRAGELLFIAMELISGHTIVEEIQERGAIPLNETFAIITEATKALAAAHSAGVVHRDLKPENIMLIPGERENRVVKVLDFGLAIVMEDNRIAMQAQRLTQQDVVMGTPGYMSPEQIHGLDVDARSDLYALGVIWWEMLTGRQLFSGRSAVEVMMRHIEERPPHPAKVNPDIRLRKREANLLASMLEKNKADRPDHAGDALVLLKECRNESAEWVTAEVEIPVGMTQEEPTDSIPIDVSQEYPSLKEKSEPKPAAPSRGAHIAASPLWSIARVGGRQEKGLTKEQLIDAARAGKFSPNDKVAQDGGLATFAGDVGWLKFPAGTSKKKVSTSSAPKRRQLTRKNKVVIGAVAIAALSAGAGLYASRMQPEKTVVAPLAEAPPQASRLVDLFPDDAITLWPSDPASAKIDAEVMLASLRKNVDFGATDAVETARTLIRSGTSDVEVFALYVANRSAMLDADKGIKDESLEDVLEKLIEERGRSMHAVAAKHLLRKKEGKKTSASTYRELLDGLPQDNAALRRAVTLGFYDEHPLEAHASPREERLAPESDAFVRARVAMAAGDYALAAEALSAPRKDGERRTAHTILDSMRLLHIGEKAKAARRIQTAVRQGEADGQSPELLHFCANVLQNAKLTATLGSPTLSRPNIGRRHRQTIIAALIATGATKAAEEAMANASSEENQDPLLDVLRAELALRKKKSKAAVVAARRALDTGGDAQYPYYTQLIYGEAQLAAGHPDLALRAFIRAADSRPDSTEALLGLLLSAPDIVGPNPKEASSSKKTVGKTNVDVDLERVASVLLNRDPLSDAKTESMAPVPFGSTLARLQKRVAQGGVKAKRMKSLAFGILSLTKKSSSTAAHRFKSVGKKARASSLQRAATIYRAAALVSSSPAKSLKLLEEVTEGKQTVAWSMVAARAAIKAKVAHDVASATLDASEKNLAKLTEVRQNRLVARLEILRGELALAQGKPDLAQKYFVHAAGLQPLSMDARRSLAQLRPKRK